MLPALRELLPRSGLVRGSVVSVTEFGVLAPALLAGAWADRAWYGISGVPQAGILAAAELGLDPERTLLVPDPGGAWPQVVASLLNGCEIVLVRLPGPVGAGNPVTLCDLGIFADQAAEPVPAANPDVCAQSG